MTPASVRRHAARGFTFIELMVAMILTSVGLLGMMTVQMVAVRSNADSRSISEATSLAQDTLEALERTPLINIVNSADANPVDVSGVANLPGSLYTRTTTVNLVGGLTNINVTVTWVNPKDPNGRRHRVVVNTVRAP